MRWATLLRVLDLLIVAIDWFRAEKHREEGRQEVLNELAKGETRAKEATDAIMAEARSPDAAVGRLRDGTF